MSKVVKAIFIGALVGLTGGLILPAIGLASPFAGIFGITNTLLAAAVGGGITAGLAVLLAPSMDLGDVQHRLSLSIDPNALGKFVFGETPCATDIMFAATHGNSDYISHIIAGAAHRIEDFDPGIYINDEYITFNPDNFRAVGEWEPGLLRRFRRGTLGQGALAPIDDGFDEVWPSEALGTGIAYFQLRWLPSFEKIQEIGGIPSRVTQVVKGCPVYDPRLDSTRGGTGSHRADDQSTWEYENSGNIIGQNWALVVVTYLLGWRSAEGDLVWGVGVDPDDIDWDQAVAAANVCDTIVDGIPKYRVSGLIALSQEHEQIIQELESAILGKVAQVGGRYYIWAPHDDLTPFSRIDEADLVREVGVEFIPSGELSDLYNTCRGRYIEPSAIYQPVPYAEIREASYIAQDGRIRSTSHDFACIQDSSIAERIARYKVRRSRFGATWKFAMGPKGLIFRPFTVTTLNIQETNFEDTLVRIVDMTISQSGVLLITCIEEDSSIYDTSDALIGPPGQNDPGPQIPATGLRLRDKNVHNRRGSTQPSCTAGVRLNANGHLQVTSAAGVWYDVLDLPGRFFQWIGSGSLSVDYWARFTLNSGGPLDVGTVDTWLPVDTSPEATVEQSGLGSKTANVTVEIADDDAGTNLLASAVYDLKAEIVNAFAAPNGSFINLKATYDIVTSLSDVSGSQAYIRLQRTGQLDIKVIGSLLPVEQPDEWFAGDQPPPGEPLPGDPGSPENTGGFIGQYYEAMMSGPISTHPNRFTTNPYDTWVGLEVSGSRVWGLTTGGVVASSTGNTLRIRRKGGDGTILAQATVNFSVTP